MRYDESLSRGIASLLSSYKLSKIGETQKNTRNPPDSYQDTK